MIVFDFGLVGGLILVALALAIALVLRIGFAADPWRVGRQLLSWALSILCAGAAAAALAYAVLFPAETPDRLRQWFHLEEGDKTAATPWVRWALVVAALLLLLLPRLWGRMVWPDVAVALVLTIAIYAVNAEHDRANKKKPEVSPPRATFSVPRSDVTILGSLDPQSKPKTIVLLVGPKVVSGRTVVSYESQRFKTQFVPCSAQQPQQLCVSLERGAEDANARGFSAALESATRIYLLPQT